MLGIYAEFIDNSWALAKKRFFRNFPAMDRAKTLTPETFRTLLGWLDADEQVAAEKYERIRERLIVVFAARGCDEPEMLADRTIDRVAEKSVDLALGYDGDQTFYFYGVGKNVYREWERSPKPVALLTENLADTRFGKHEEWLSDLRERLESLPTAERELLIDYYGCEKTGKIACRKKIAKRLGTSIKALQMRVLRLRRRFEGRKKIRRDKK